MSVSSPDLFLHTPNLTIDILRDQAADLRRVGRGHRGAAPQRLQSELRLPDQEARGPVPGHPGGGRFGPGAPEDLNLLYVRCDDGSRLVPLNAVARWRETLGPSAVSHLNQFTSVTINLNRLPFVPMQTAVDFIENAAKEVAAGRHCAASSRARP